MRVAPTALIVMLLESAALAAAPECTNEPRSRWMNEIAFRDSLKQQGYVVKKFKVVKRCYEIYGADKLGRKVEVYFSPVTGQVIKSRVDS